MSQKNVRLFCSEGLGIFLEHSIFLKYISVNHPYCNSGSDGSLDRQNKICRPALWNEPIYISAHSCGPPPNCPDTAANLPLITGASLAAALVLAIGLVLIHRILCRRQRWKQNFSKNKRFSILVKPPTILGFGSYSLFGNVCPLL